MINIHNYDIMRLTKKTRRTYNRVEISKSDNKEKRYKAIFYDNDDKIKTTHFGQKNPTGKGAFPDHKDPEVKKNWIKRHEVRGNFEDPTTASALSRWILWNKPSVRESISNYKHKFNLA